MTGCDYFLGGAVHPFLTGRLDNRAPLPNDTIVPMRLRSTVIGVLMMAAALSGARAEAATPVDDLLGHLPPEAELLLLAPHLRNTNDQIVQLLEGMDRPNLLMGSRPLDLAKTLTDFSVAIDELKPAALLILKRSDAGGDENHDEKDEKEEAQSPPLRWLLVLPASDRAAFLARNLVLTDDDEIDAGEPRQAEHRRLGPCHVFAAGSTIFLSNSESALQKIAQLTEQDRDRRRRIWRERLQPADHSAETTLLTWSNSGAWPGFLQKLTELARRRAPGWARPNEAGPNEAGPNEAGPQLAARLSREIDQAVIAIQFDPLGVFVSGYWQWSEGHALRETPLAALGKSPLRSLPSRPYRAVLAADLSGWPEEMLPDAWRQITRFQFAAFAEGRAGAMTDAALAIDSGEAEHAERFFRDLVSRVIGEHALLEMDRSGADAPRTEYRVRFDHQPATPRAMFLATVFHPNEWRGVLQRDGGRTFVTLSARTGMLEWWQRVDEKQDLAADPVLRSMQPWFPGRVEFLLALNPARALEPYRPLLREAAARAGVRWRAFDDGAPPLTVAAGRSAEGIDASIILPAAALGPGVDMLADLLIQGRLRRELENAR